jgi:hypothetical protein
MTNSDETKLVNDVMTMMMMVVVVVMVVMINDTQFFALCEYQIVATNFIVTFSSSKVSNV